MKVIVAAVGRPRDTALAAAIDTYERRAARYWPLEVRPVRSESAASASPDLVRQREAERLAAKLGDARLIVCDERGAGLSSAAFSAFLQRSREGAEDVAFVVGGPFGVADALRERAARVLALAPFTLSHELARLVLAEQLYRAGTIVRGEPYHK